MAGPSPLSAMRDLLLSKIMGRSPHTEHAVAILPSGLMVGPKSGSGTAVNLAADPRWAEFVKGSSSEPLGSWGTAHSHPGYNPQGGLPLKWVSNGPSSGDYHLISQLPGNADHQVWHPRTGVQEFYSAPDLTGLLDFAKSTTGSDRTAVLDLMNPRRYLSNIEGLTLPDSFDRTGAAARGIEAALRRRGLLDLSNTGSSADNTLIDEVAESVGKRLPFCNGGLAQAMSHG